MKKSRSELFSRALDQYVARHAPDHVTETMNEVKRFREAGHEAIHTLDLPLGRIVPQTA